MLERLSPAIAANRFGLSARPGELAQIGAQPLDWLIAQFAGSASLLTGPELHSSAETLARGLEVRRGLRAAKRAAAEATTDPDGPQVAVFDTTVWDTHANDGNAEGHLAGRLAALDAGLRTLKTSLDGRGPTPLWCSPLSLDVPPRRTERAEGSAQELSQLSHPGSSPRICLKRALKQV